MYGRAKSQMSLYKLTMMGRRTDKQTDRQKKRLIGAQAFALPKNQTHSPEDDHENSLCTFTVFLAKAEGVAVGRCLDGRLKTKLVATIYVIFSPFPPLFTFLTE